MALRFEWDPAKATSNRTKHGITFEMAQETFKDSRAVVEIDDREDYGEERLIRICHGRTSLSLRKLRGAS